MTDNEFQNQPCPWNLLAAAAVSTTGANMRTHLPHLSATAWALIALPVMVVARCVVMTVVPQVIHAVVPEVVRNVIRVI